MQNQKPLGTRILSLALTAAMVATMMPQNVFAEGTAPQVQGDTLTTTRTITAVGELGEGFAKPDPFDGHTYVLDVKANTPLSEVKLPTELSVTVEKITTKASAPAVETPVAETPVAETPAASEVTSTEPAAPTTDANTTVLGNEPATPSGAEPAPVEKPAEVAPPVANQGNATIIETTQENIPVTWKGDKEYTADPNSNVVYTAVLPEGYALKDGVVLPSINVKVGKKIMTAMQAMPRAVTTVQVGTADELKTAISSVAADTTIQLTKDINLGGTGVTTPSNNVSFTIDLNGHKLTSSNVTITHSGTGTLTITDSASNGTVSALGSIYSYAICNSGSGTVSVAKGTVTTTDGKAIYNERAGTINVSGGTVSATTTGIAIYNERAGTINVSGGTVSANTGNAINNGSTGVISVSGDAKVTSKYYAANMGTIYLAGGTVNTEILKISGTAIVENTNGGNAIWNNASGTISMTGGTVSATTTGKAIYNFNTGAINVSGGTVSAANGNAIYNYQTGKITVSDGATVTSQNTDTSNGTIYFFRVPTGDDKVILTVESGAQVTNTTPEGYAAYFPYGTKVTNYYTVAVGSTLGKVYPVPSKNITFDSRGGSAVTDVEIGDTMSLPVSTWDGYTFDGWYSGIDGTDAATSPAFTGRLTWVTAKALTASTTVYANWTKGGKMVRTTPLDLSTASTDINKLETEGWKWDNTTKTLTLSGANIDCSGNAATENQAFGIQLEGDCKIVLTDGTTNTVKSGASNSFSKCVWVRNNCSISGTGTLNAIGGASGSGYESYGIYCNTSATLTVNDATINASSIVSTKGYGIDGNLDVQSGKITATGTGTDTGYGIRSNSVVMSGGTVIANGTGAMTSTGVSAASFSMTGGTITTTGSVSCSTGYGIEANNFTMTGGTMSTSGKTAIKASNGITAEGAAIMGSKTNADGSDATAIEIADVDAAYKYLNFSFIKAVTFDSRGGSAVQSAKIAADGTIAMPTPPTWTGYTFDGWYTGIDGTGTAFVNSNLTASTTVYAKWIAANGKAVRTTSLDLSTASTDINKLETEGWKWDNNTKTLTLDGATIDCTGNAVSNSPVSGIQLMNDCNIVLADGTVNTVKAGNATDTVSIGINFKVRSGSATGASISGKGTLYATGGETRNGNMGIMCSDATLTVRDATIIAASSAETVTGVGIASKLDVKSGTITATGTGSTFGYGIQSMSMTMSGGTVTATGIATGTVGTEEYGMYGMGEVNLTGGTLSASGKTAAITVDDGDISTTTDSITAATATVTGANENSFESGVTKTLTQTDTANPVVISFTKAVNFDSRNGDPITTAKIAENGTIAMPTPPTWGDYTFGGWYTKVDGTGTAFVNSNLTSSTTVYAKWTKGGKAVLTETLDLSTATDISGDGWKWDYTAKTLTLSGITLNSTKLNASNYATGILFPNEDCTIILEDGTENTVDVSSAKNTDSSYGIYTDFKLTIKTSGKGTPGKLNAIAGNANDPSHGIYAGGGIVIESGNITAKAGDSTIANSAGIWTNAGDIHIKGGTVNATSGKSANSDIGALSAGIFGANIQIDDGTVTATGSEEVNALKFSGGILGTGTVKLNGGIINAKGTTAAIATSATDGLVIDDIANVKVNGNPARVGTKMVGGADSSTLVNADDTIITNAAIKFKLSYKGENPLAPNAAKAKRTHNTITLETKTIAGEIVEYGIDNNGTITWQDSPIFGDLTAGTEYTFCSRVKASDNHKAGATSAETIIKTKTAPVSVSGTVKDNGDTALDGATVELKQGVTVVKTTTTNASGVYSFTDVPEGVYNLVITKVTGDSKVTITESVTVTGANLTGKDMKFLDGKKNTEVESKPGTPEVAVGGLNDLLNTTNLNTTLEKQEEQAAVAAGGSVDLTFTADLKTPGNVGTDKEEIEKVANGQKIDLLLDLSVLKTVKDKDGKPVTINEKIETLAGIIAINIPIPAELQGKADLNLYRMHKGEAKALPKGQGAAVNDEYYTIDPSGTFMTVYVKNFSTYAIGYTAFDVTITDGGAGASGTGKYAAGDVVTIDAGSKSGYTFSGWTVTPNNVTLANANSATTSFVMTGDPVKLTANWTYTGGGNPVNPGGNPAPEVYYYINATTSRGGSINTPERVKVVAGGSASFTITPDKGYQIADVLVNGNSIGAKNSYVFTNVNADQTIHATFKKAGHRNPQTGVDANVD